MISYTTDLLLPYKHTSGSWLSTDSQALYTHNLQRQPADWYYRTNSVEYTWNSNGYRAPEWSDIVWSDTRLLMGCSFALGLGVRAEDMITGGVERAVTLAQCGISIANIQYNTIRLIDAGIRPLRVDVIIPPQTRAVYWAESDWADLTVQDLLARGDGLTASVRDYYQGYLALDPNAEFNSYMAGRSVQALWQSAGVECTLWHTPLEFDPRFKLGEILPPIVDQARDVGFDGTAHPGRQTLALWRDCLYS